MGQCLSGSDIDTYEQSVACTSTLGKTSTSDKRLFLCGPRNSVGSFKLLGLSFTCNNQLCYLEMSNIFKKERVVLQNIEQLKTSTGAVSENIVDLQKIVSDSAWQMYSDCRQKDFPKFMKNVRLVFDWSGVKFIPEEPEYSEEVKDQVKSNILFESVFCNNSNKEQQHSLKTEQQTTATCKSSLTKGYTTGFNVGLSLASPAAIVGTTAGFSKGFSVENAFETEDQKTMTWAAEGVLLVEKESEVTAKLQITEQKSTYSFTTRVAVKGAVLVEFYKRKNNEYLMHYKADMRTILVEKQDKIKTEKGEILVEDREGTVYLKLGGKCVFKYGIKQEIIINQNGKNKQIKS